MLTFPIPTARVCVSSKGIVDTAIGGQRIEEFLVNDTTINSCSNSRVDAGVWNGQLWAKMVMPFVDTTVKGWAWYVLHTINNLISTLFFFLLLLHHFGQLEDTMECADPPSAVSSRVQVLATSFMLTRAVCTFR